MIGNSKGKPGIQATLERRAFTLVELLVSMTIFVILMALLFSVFDQSQKVWLSSRARISAFREARIAFESLTSTLSRASLNPYWDYDDPNNPRTYVRKSELRFTSGPGLLGGENTPCHSVFFQAPLGMTSDPNYRGLETIFNSCGYYLEYADDSSLRPEFLDGVIENRSRFRLMQWLEPGGKWALFDKTSGNPGYSGQDWFQSPVNAKADRHVLAENVIALVILPKRSEVEDAAGTSLAPAYSYDSAPQSWPPAVPQKPTENQLPAVVQITMVTLDETSADRLEDLSAGSPIQFLGLEGLFQSSSKLEEDLETLTSLLSQYNLRYRVLQSAINIRGAKWSSE
jgi:uncharacterized protein (TIGR02599 family)